MKPYVSERAILESRGPEGPKRGRTITRRLGKAVLGLPKDMLDTMPAKRAVRLPSPFGSERVGQANLAVTDKALRLTHKWAKAAKEGVTLETTGLPFKLTAKPGSNMRVVPERRSEAETNWQLHVTSANGGETDMEILVREGGRRHDPKVFLGMVDPVNGTLHDQYRYSTEEQHAMNATAFILLEALESQSAAGALQVTGGTLAEAAVAA